VEVRAGGAEPEAGDIWNIIQKAMDKRMTDG
jgi:hypothetical protein